MLTNILFIRNALYHHIREASNNLKSAMKNHSEM